ncbi:hypothetical protein AGRA3207_002746 [Actinomadura graeca]|uniref:Uncharacterized protein n=1 Tax=Actinomadura graeca TaxID=2750812 RepID=A0ABX8QSS5_9ACTN|nr:DUF6098 family protein [Actinomadura graeca]QXJ21845.1 hypothetical protein AGRA3207_002746 [Actinomadura graeca]
MDLPTLTTLDQLVRLLDEGGDLFIRWSRGPDADASNSSRDDLTGAPLPGLSANPLAVEEWWPPRPLRLWAARRLHDYSHLEKDKGPGVRPWVLEGEERGRGPDNEPLVHCLRPVAWVAEDVLWEAERLVAEQDGDWGALRRSAPGGRPPRR